VAQPLRVWFDPEGDFLEVVFSESPGYMRETEDDAIMERVDAEGHVIGFSILQVSKLARNKPIAAQLGS
jgi:uncharacterized protein YuzE